MKKLLIICCLFITTNVVVHAQASTSIGKAPFSKSEFLSKVDELNTLIEEKKIVDANATWEDVLKMLNRNISDMEGQVEAAKNETEKTDLSGAMKEKVDIYRTIIELHIDLTNNKIALHDELEAFAKTIL